jgi:hypothetical protein
MNLPACFLIGIVGNALVNAVRTWHQGRSVADWWVDTRAETAAIVVVASVCLVGYR